MSLDSRPEEVQPLVPQDKNDVIRIPDQIDVSVILPIYDERGHIQQEIDRIRKAFQNSSYSYELIVVDDGSTDGGPQELLSTPDVRLIRLATNKGTGAARRIGTEAASGRVVVWTDVDMSYPNHEIPSLVRNMAQYDQVVGARTSEEGTQKALRVPAKWVIRKIASYLLRTPIPDLNSGFRAFRRDVGVQFLHLLPDGFSCVTTMTMVFLTNGYSVGYIAIPYGTRAGSSKFRPWTDTSRYLKQVLRLVIGYEPLRVFTPIAFLLGLVSSGGIIYDTVVGRGIGPNPLLAALAAFNVLMAGFLADLIVMKNKTATRVRPAAVTDQPSEDAPNATVSPRLRREERP